MVIRQTPRLVPGLLSALLILVGLCLVPEGDAKIMRNTVDPVVTVTDQGRRLIVTGPITCSTEERVDVRVTVTQRTTGAVAEGQTRFLCTGAAQQWEIEAVTLFRPDFEDGPATVVAIARTTVRKADPEAQLFGRKRDGQGGTRSPHRVETTDAHQWLVEVTLVERAE